MLKGNHFIFFKIRPNQLSKLFRMALYPYQRSGALDIFEDPYYHGKLDFSRKSRVTIADNDRMAQISEKISSYFILIRI